MKIEKLSKLLRLFLEFVFVVGVIDLITIYWTMPMFFGDIFPGQFFWPALILLAICVICVLAMLRFVIKMLKTVEQTNPFISQNVTALKSISIFCFVISALWVGLLFFSEFNILMSLILLLFFVAGFLCLILSAIFRNAVEYKNRNDMAT